MFVTPKSIVQIIICAKESTPVDEDLADQVWRLWDAGVIGDETSAIAWWLIATSYAVQPCHKD